MLRHSSKRSCPGYHGQAWPITSPRSAGFPPTPTPTPTPTPGPTPQPPISPVSPPSRTSLNWIGKCG